MHHVRCMASPELNVVQGAMIYAPCEVHGKP